jgi:hypothetical protein
MRKPDWEVFEKKFKPNHNTAPDQESFRIYEPHNKKDWTIIKKTKKSYIWTIVDGDNGNIYLTPGYKYVNRIGYIICKNPHQFEKTRNYKY